jgi:hypothetical protein
MLAPKQTESKTSEAKAKRAMPADGEHDVLQTNPTWQALALTMNGATKFHPSVEHHPRRAEIHAHESVHRKQFRSPAQAGSRRQLELDAEQGASTLLSGREYVPQYSAPPNRTLAFNDPPLMPGLSSSVEANFSSLSTLGPQARQTATINATSGKTEQPAGAQSVHYHIDVTAGGPRGSITTLTDLSASYDPGTPVGTALGTPVARDIEFGLAPPVPVTLYPVVITHHRRLDLSDADGRNVTVTVDSQVNFTHETWARVIAGRQPTFETLLDLQGDLSSISITLSGSGPLQPYYAQYSFNGASLNIQSAAAETALMGGAGVLPFSSLVPARFVRAELTAGEQFDSLEAFLVSADAVELNRRAEQERARHNEAGAFGELLSQPNWLSDAIVWLADAIAELWNSLPESIRGILTSIGKFIAGLALLLGAAALIVLLAPEEIAFGTAMLIVGAIAFAYTFVTSFISRTIEAIRAGEYNPSVWLTVAVLDTVGLSGLLEAITDRSIISGQPLRRSLEQRWEAGTTGILTMLATILFVRGALGRPVPVESGGGGGRGLPPLDTEPGRLPPVEQEGPPRINEPLRGAEPPVEPAYDAAGRSDAQLLLDTDPTPRPGETPEQAVARARAAQQEIEWRQVQRRYQALPERPPHIDIATNDATYADAHTLRRHGPEIPMERSLDANGQPDGTRTIEGRIFGDPPWNVDGGRQSFSARWFSEETINITINRYLRANWEAIRSDLALDGEHSNVFTPEQGGLVGEGYFNRNYGTPNPPASGQFHGSLVSIALRFVPGNPPTLAIITTFPNLRGF